MIEIELNSESEIACSMCARSVLSASLGSFIFFNKSELGSHFSSLSTLLCLIHIEILGGSSSPPPPPPLPTALELLLPHCINVTIRDTKHSLIPLVCVLSDPFQTFPGPVVINNANSVPNPSIQRRANLYITLCAGSSSV